MIDRKLLADSRILIVDDNAANVMLLERILQMAGYRNHSAVTDSREVLERFRTWRPDLILLDLMMPNMDGYAVLRQLGGWIPDRVYLPVLVITADTTPSARKRAMELGARDFLTKPIDAMEATLRVNNLLTTRWLYSQIESRDQVILAQAATSKQKLEASLKELDRVMAASGSSDLSLLRYELLEAAAAIGKLNDSDDAVLAVAS
ncbi:MAG TPA: response regulator [Bryobacteraceae bacterium]|jgi:putative two-component system response regulator